MKNEAEACTIFKNSVIAAGGKCTKIPDPSNDFQSTIQRPFDLFGAYSGFPFYAEAKHMKGGLFSFDLQTIEDHQIANLVGYHHQIPTAQCWIILAVNVARGDNRIYLFEDILEIERRRVAHENFKQKELLTLPFFKIKKDLIDFTTYPLNRKEEP